MRALLDVNVLVALIDPDHAFSNRAHGWLETDCQTGWSSCPLTENGVVRILSNPGYSKKIRNAPEWIISSLIRFTRDSDHVFWPDDVSLREPTVFEAGKILGSRQVSDLYLLGLAVKNGGRLVTFDEGINLAAVRGASVKNLHVIR